MQVSRKRMNVHSFSAVGVGEIDTRHIREGEVDRSDRHPTTEDDVRPGILDEAAAPARGDKRERVLEAALELFTDRDRKSVV